MSVLDLGTVLARVDMKVMTKISNEKFNDTLYEIMRDVDKEDIFAIIKYREGADNSRRWDIVKKEELEAVTNPHACIIKKIPYEGIYINNIQQKTIEEFTNNLLLTLMDML